MFSDKYLQKYKSNLIPDMTSNILPLGEAFTNNAHSGSLFYDAWRAFSDIDKENSGAQSSWCTRSDKGLIGYDFKKSVIVNVYSMQCTLIQTGTTNYFPLNWTFEGFNNDDNKWTILDSVSNFREWDKFEDKEVFFICNNKKYFTKYRLNIQSSNSYIQIKRIKMYCNKSAIFKCLIKQDDKYYSLRDEYYNNHNYDSLNINKLNEDICKNYSFDDINELLKSVTFGDGESTNIGLFKDKFNLLIYKGCDE